MCGIRHSLPTQIIPVLHIMHEPPKYLIFGRTVATSVLGHCIAFVSKNAEFPLFAMEVGSH